MSPSGDASKAVKLAQTCPSGPSFGPLCPLTETRAFVCVLLYRLGPLFLCRWSRSKLAYSFTNHIEKTLLASLCKAHDQFSFDFPPFPLPSSGHVSQCPNLEFWEHASCARNGNCTCHVENLCRKRKKNPLLLSAAQPYPFPVTHLTFFQPLSFGTLNRSRAKKSPSCPLPLYMSLPFLHDPRSLRR